MSERGHKQHEKILKIFHVSFDEFSFKLLFIDV